MSQTVYTITVMVGIHNRPHYKATFYDIAYGLKVAMQATKQLLDEQASIRIDIDPHYMSVGEFITFVG